MSKTMFQLPLPVTNFFDILCVLITRLISLWYCFGIARIELQPADPHPFYLSRFQLFG